MRGAPVAPVDLSVYAKAVLLLLRNPAIVVVPLLMAVIGVLLTLVMVPYGGGMSGLTGQLASFIATLLEFFGLGAACIMADDAWRHGRASFDNGWTEARRRGGDILFAAIGVIFVLFVAAYAGMLIGPLAVVLTVAAVVFLVWTIPAAAIGGVPGGAAIQVSVDRVRGAPLAAVVVAVVSYALLALLVPYAGAYLGGWLMLLTGAGSLIPLLLLHALLQAIASGYIALILAKTYSDAAFGTRRY
jgi:hypothetical protein